MPAPRVTRLKLSPWWCLPPVTAVLVFNIVLERKWPSIPGIIQFLLLLGASVIAFGVTFGALWLIRRLREPWDNP